MTQDLVVLAADKDTEFALRGLLLRHQALGLPPITYQIFVHPMRDPGVLRQGVDFLRSFQGQFRHALMVFDREGSGMETHSAEAIEDHLALRLVQAGWDDRARALVLDPELEIWVWSDSPKVDACLRWGDRTPPLRAWLRDRGFLAPGAQKPGRPKEAMEAVLRHTTTARSSAIYERLAQTVSLDRCTDPALDRLRATLTRWFALPQVGS